MGEEGAGALRDCFIALNDNLEEANVVDGLLAIAGAMNRVGAAIEHLGLANAGTPMGAMEVMSMEIRDGLRLIASAVEESRDA